MVTINSLEQARDKRRKEEISNLLLWAALYDEGNGRGGHWEYEEWLKEGEKKDGE